MRKKLLATLILLAMLGFVATSCASEVLEAGGGTKDSKGTITFDPSEENPEYEIYDFSDWAYDESGTKLGDVTVRVADGSHGDINIQLYVPEITNEKITYLMSQYGYQAILVNADDDIVLSSPCVLFFRNPEEIGRVLLTKAHITPEDVENDNWIMELATDYTTFQVIGLLSDDEIVSDYIVTFSNDMEDLIINTINLKTDGEETTGTSEGTIQPDLVETYADTSTDEDGYTVELSVDIYDDVINPTKFIYHPGNGQVIDAPTGDGNVHIIPFTFRVTNKTDGFSMSGIKRQINFWTGYNEGFAGKNVKFWDSAYEEWRDINMDHLGNYSAYYNSGILDSGKSSVSNGYLYLEDVHTPEHPDGYDSEESGNILVIYEKEFGGENVEFFFVKNDEGKIVTTDEDLL